MINRIWELVCNIADKDGVAPLNELPGCWYKRLNEQYEFAVNGRTEATKCDELSVTVQPFHLYVQFNGWPFAVLTPYGGEIGAGTLANADTFIAALEGATA